MHPVMESGTERDLRDNLMRPFQAGAGTLEPTGVKQLTQGVSELVQKPTWNPVLSSKGHLLPRDP